MNYLLDIKQDLLVIPNGETIAQQSAISNLWCFFPLYSGYRGGPTCLDSLAAKLSYNPMVMPPDKSLKYLSTPQKGYSH